MIFIISEHIFVLLSWSLLKGFLTLVNDHWCTASGDLQSQQNLWHIFIQSCNRKRYYTRTPHAVKFQVTETQTHASPTVCNCRPTPWLTLPGCHNDWACISQREWWCHLITVFCLSFLLTFCLSSPVCLSVGMSSQSASFSLCLVDWELDCLSPHLHLTVYKPDSGVFYHLTSHPTVFLVSVFPLGLSPTKSSLFFSLYIFKI